MDKDDRDLVNRLFVTATVMLEDLTEIAVAGQLTSTPPQELRALGEALTAEARRLAIVASAAMIIARRSATEAPPRKDPR